MDDASIVIVAHQGEEVAAPHGLNQIADRGPRQPQPLGDRSRCDRGIAGDGAQDLDVGSSELTRQRHWSHTPARSWRCHP
jgi:hypothetical protein